MAVYSRHHWLHRRTRLRGNIMLPVLRRRAAPSAATVWRAVSSPRGAAPSSATEPTSSRPGAHNGKSHMDKCAQTTDLICSVWLFAAALRAVGRRQADVWCRTNPPVRVTHVERTQRCRLSAGVIKPPAGATLVVSSPNSARHYSPSVLKNCHPRPWMAPSHLPRVQYFGLVCFSFFFFSSQLKFKRQYCVVYNLGERRAGGRLILKGCALLIFATAAICFIFYKGGRRVCSTAEPSGREHFDWGWRGLFMGTGLSWLKKVGGLNSGSALGQV